MASGEGAASAADEPGGPMGHLNARASGPGHVGTRGDSGQGWRGDCAYEDVGIVGILVKKWGVGRGDFEKYATSRDSEL